MCSPIVRQCSREKKLANLSGVGANSASIRQRSRRTIIRRLDCTSTQQSNNKQAWNCYLRQVYKVRNGPSDSESCPKHSESCPKESEPFRKVSDGVRNSPKAVRRSPAIFWSPNLPKPSETNPKQSGRIRSDSERSDLVRFGFRKRPNESDITFGLFFENFGLINKIFNPNRTKSSPKTCFSDQFVDFQNFSDC